MATRPYPKVLTGTSVDIINAIRNSASVNYRDYVPYATPDAESIKEIGAIIMDYPALQNEFLTSLINRIGRVTVTSKMYDNPIQMFKKGFLEFGESIEEIFVTLAKPFQFDPETAETNVFKREIPDVRSAFHIMNYQKFYKITVSQDQLRQAFLSWDGVVDLISKIVEQAYTSASYDEFITMKYLIAKRILNGQLALETYDTSATVPSTALAKSIKTISNNMEFMSPNYNLAGVKNFALKNDQYLLITAKADAEMDVDTLATAFNMDKVEFLGHRVLVDGFGKLDTERLAELFDGDLNYTEFTSAELEALDTIPAILIDKDWFMVFDNLSTFTENYNGEGLYWNYFYHVWKTFSTSPFANGVMFIGSLPTYRTVTIQKSGESISNGEKTVVISLTATVSGTGVGMNRRVKWELDETTIPSGVNATVNGAGILTITRNESTTPIAGIKVKATALGDGTKTATYTVS